MEWTKQTYNEQYEKWVPWLEDLYLRYFTKDNKASYTTRGTFYRHSKKIKKQILSNYFFFDVELTYILDTLDKTKVTGIEQVDTLQDGVHNLVSSQVGQGGLLQPIGDVASKEGANRAERQGKGEDGQYIPGGDAASKAASGVADGGKAVAGAAASGVKSAGGFLGGAVGMGGQKNQEEQQKA